MIFGPERQPQSNASFLEDICGIIYARQRYPSVGSLPQMPRRLVHCPNSQNSWCWARPKARSQGCSPRPQVAGRDPGSEATTTASQGACSPEAGIRSKQAKTPTQALR